MHLCQWTLISVFSSQDQSCSLVKYDVPIVSKRRSRWINNSNGECYLQILFLTEHNFEKEKQTEHEHQDLLYKDISLILTGHRSDTLKLVVATSLSGSWASFSFTKNLLNKQSLYSIFINKIIIKGCLYLKTGFNLQFGNYNRYWVHAFFGLNVQGLSRTRFLLAKKSIHCKTILINNDHFYLFIFYLLLLSFFQLLCRISNLRTAVE